MKTAFLLTILVSLALVQTQTQEYLPKDGPIPICDAFTQGIARSGLDDFTRLGAKSWRHVMSAYPVRLNAVTKITFYQLVGNYFMFGAGNLPDYSALNGGYVGGWPNSIGFHTINGAKYMHGVGASSYSSATTTGDNITMIIDLRPFKKTVSFAKNGVPLGIIIGGINLWKPEVYIFAGIFQQGHRFKITEYQVTE